MGGWKRNNGGLLFHQLWVHFPAPYIITSVAFFVGSVYMHNAIITSGQAFASYFTYYFIFPLTQKDNNPSHTCICI